MPEEHAEQENPIEGNNPETQPEIEKSEASPTPEEEKSRVLDRFKMEKEPLQQKYMTRDKTMYCSICNRQIEKYGKRKEDFKKPGWVFCPKHGWIQEGIHNKEVVSEQPVRLSVEKVPEEHAEQETIEGNESEILSEGETPEVSSIPEEALKDNISKTTEKTTYCTICNKQIEKYGKRKEDFKKPGWVFCPKHGWIQEGIHDKEVVSEQPVRLSIEEVPGEHAEQEIPLEGKESEILYKIEKPETFPIPEEEQWETDLSDERELRTTDLPIGGINVVRNKSTSIGIIFTVIFITLLLSFTLGYFAWKNSSSESLRIKSLRALVQKEDLTTQVQSQASTSPQESVLVERSTEEVKSDTSAPPQEAVSQSGNTEPKEKIKVTPSQFQKPSHEIFTVQIGAFTDVSYAKSLKKRLDKKGYKIYITSSNSKKEGRIYKVWTGKFSNREKADTFAAKITKTEGIQTFVTLWKKQ